MNTAPVLMPWQRDPTLIGAALLWPVTVMAAPMLALPLTIFLAIWAWQPKAGVALPAALSVALTMFNVTKLRVSDLADYRRILLEAGTSDFLPYLLRSNFGSIREHEYLFKALAWVLAKFTPVPDSALVVVGTLAIYGSSIFLVTMIRRLSERHSPEAFAPGNIEIAAAIVAGITFSLTAHLIRQYLAASMIAVGMSLYVSGRTRKGWVFLLLSPLMHQSAALMLALFFGATTLFASRNWFTASVKLVAAIAISAVGALALAQDYFMESATKFATDEGALSPALFALDGVLCVWAAWQLRRYVAQEYAKRLLVVFALPALTLLLSGALFSFPFLALRMYFYVEPFRPLFIAFAASFFMVRLSPGFRPAARAVLIALVMAFFLQRVAQSPWHYVASFPRAVFLSMPRFLS